MVEHIPASFTSLVFHVGCNLHATNLHITTTYALLLQPASSVFVVVWGVRDASSLRMCLGDRDCIGYYSLPSQPSAT